MDRHFTVYRRLATDEPPAQVFTAVEHALRSAVGGSIQRVDSSFHVYNGTNNLNFAFAGDLYAIITLTQSSSGVVDTNGTITLKPNALFWISAVGGFFCLFSWGVNFVYFIIDPRLSYQMALDRIQLSTPYGDPAPPPKQYGR